MRVFVLRFTNVTTFKRVLRESCMMKKSWYQYLSTARAWGSLTLQIERDTVFSVTYDHFLVPRILVLSTYYTKMEEQFMTVIFFFHVLWFYILLLWSGCTILGNHQWMVPRNECINATYSITLYKCNHVQESLTRELNEKHKKLICIFVCRSMQKYTV